MTQVKRLSIIVTLVVAVGIIFAVPYFKKGDVAKFAVTPQPAAKLQSALQDKKPVFLEFWSPK